MLQLKSAWHDGTTHLELDPLDFVARCAALVRSPHNAAHARLRERSRRGRGFRRPAKSTPGARGTALIRRRGPWADVIRRAFGYDLLACPRCGGKMELLACILDGATIRRILAHEIRRDAVDVPSAVTTVPRPVTPVR